MGGVRWAERLAGPVSFDQTDFNQALMEGRRDGARMVASLTLQVDDIDDYVKRDRRVARVGGYVDFPGLLGLMPIVWGEFELLAKSNELFDHLHLRMRYRLNLRDAAGRELRLSGFKLVENDPGYDSWHDTSTLFVHVFRDWWPVARAGGEVQPEEDANAESVHPEEALAHDEHPDDEPLATAVLKITPGGFLRELASFEGTQGSLRAKLRDVLSYGGVFAGGLAKAYWGRPIADGRPSFPRDRPPPPWEVAEYVGEWRPVPGREEDQRQIERPPLQRRVVPVAVDDLAFPLNLHHVAYGDRPPPEPSEEAKPVLLVPGAGLRAEMYYGQPEGVTLVDVLLREGYDVWVMNWRASIDLPNVSYTLDQVAKYDHPAAVEKVIELSGAPTLRAVVHCMGSVSFIASAAAGLLPAGRVTDVVANGISLFFEVSGAMWVKQRLLVPIVNLLGSGADPQWGIRPQTPTAGMMARLAGKVQLQCGNAPCQVTNFVYGHGPQVLLRHRNVTDRVHAWSARELGYTPFSVFTQVAESCRNGELTPVAGSTPDTPASYTAAPPRTGDTRFTFLGGDQNEMFSWRGQQQSAEFFKRCRRQAAFVRLPGYGHIDPFWGMNAPAEVFPTILQGLRWSETGTPPQQIVGALEELPKAHLLPRCWPPDCDASGHVPVFSAPPLKRSRARRQPLPAPPQMAGTD